MNNFYLNRLKTFSLAEFPFRIKQMLKSKLEEKLFQEKPTLSIQAESKKRILNPIIVNSNPGSHTLNIFGKYFNYKNIQPADWHCDFFSGNSFPMSFSKKIDIRKKADLSAKVVWEVNRLQFLMQISLNYQNTKDISYLNDFMNLIKSWKENNPYLVGVNWYSNIEVNLRLINWFLCWEALDADDLIKENESFNQFVKNDWLPLIYQHCIYSFKNPSKYSSANNHLISEYAGLFIAASKWTFKESEKWIKYSQNGLETEIIKQHTKHGINKEEAAEYIQFITDFFLLAHIVAENTNRPFSQSYKHQLYQIFDYIYNFLDCNGNFPKYGDEDDGKCYIIDFDERFNNFKSLLTSAAIIYKDSAFKYKSNGVDVKNLFLFGKKGKQIFQSIPDIEIQEKSKLYTDDGHFILRKKENDKEIYIHFDAAPLGFLSIAAHGHADALSFILHIDGEPFFIDSGTYTYHTEMEWRNYFVGTSAHNTIRINKENQATIAGATLWLKHYKSEVLRAETNDDFDRVIARHNGYKKSGIIHTREIVFQKKTNVIRIRDSIDCKKPEKYSIEIPFHLHPSITINNTKNKFDLSNNKNRNITLETDYKLSSRILKGKTEPEIFGWYSDSFTCKEPCNTIVCSLETSGNMKFETVISIN
jgi:hypothetical protein